MNLPLVSWTWLLRRILKSNSLDPWIKTYISSGNKSDIRIRCLFEQFQQLIVGWNVVWPSDSENLTLMFDIVTTYIYIYIHGTNGKFICDLVKRGSKYREITSDFFMAFFRAKVYSLQWDQFQFPRIIIIFTIYNWNRFKLPRCWYTLIMDSRDKRSCLNFALAAWTFSDFAPKK